MSLRWGVREGVTRRRRRRRRVLIAAAVVLLAPALPIAALRWLPPPTSAFMLQARSGLGDAPSCPVVHHRWTPRARIAAAAKLAVIASEDQRFAMHWGLDFTAIGNALEERGRLRGASTISQQVAKNLFLWPAHSWLRKGLEAWLTGWIELLWPKRRILEVYLNVAQFGPCTFGVGAAAPRFFGRSPGELDPWRAALLAAVLPDPVRLDAGRPSAYVEERSRWILGQMQRLRRGHYLDRL